MKVCYKDRTFADSSMAIIAAADQIIAEYADAGILITLRQLYYRFVAAGLIENTIRSYKRLASIVNDARLAGYIDWDAIVDRTRNSIISPHWETPARAMDAIVDQYRIDTWEGQEYRVEVWIEKDALASVFEPVTRELDVRLFPCRGYTSQSEMWAGAQRFRECYRNGQTPVVLHFGDHDPSGIDMSRDIMDRSKMFLLEDLSIDMDDGRLDEDFAESMQDMKFHRIALNMDQVEEYQPPPNPAKATDSRFKSYRAEFGSSSWELDALEPSVLAELIRDNVAKWRDDDLMEERVADQERGRELLKSARSSIEGAA